MIICLTKKTAVVILILGMGVSIFGGCKGGNHDKSNSDSSMVKKVEKKKGKVGTAKYEYNEEKALRDRNGVYNKVEMQPQFPGGQDALSIYIQNHVTYPDQALSENISGTVRVSFIVDEHGKVVQPKVIGDTNGNKELEKEALRVVSQMPAWKPGKVKGKNVKTRLELPITFQAEA